MALRRKGGFAGAATVAAAGFVGAALTADPASAAFTIDFGTNPGGGNAPYTEDGFTFDPGTRTNGNCPTGGSGSCLLLNPGLSNSIEMTFADGVFELLGFSLNFVPQDEGSGGSKLVLIVEGESSDLSSPKVEIFDSLDEPTVSVAGAFADVTKVTFSLDGQGSLRIDDVSAVPLPAAAWMFLAGLGVVGGVIGRRRRAAAAAA